MFRDFACVDENIWEEGKYKKEVGEIPHNQSKFWGPKLQPTFSPVGNAFALAALTFSDRDGVKLFSMTEYPGPAV